MLYSYLLFDDDGFDNVRVPRCYFNSLRFVRPRTYLHDIMLLCAHSFIIIHDDRRVR